MIYIVNKNKSRKIRMAGDFSIDTRELKKLIKEYEISAKKIPVIQANVLNSYAFGSRSHAIKVIDRRMTVRNRRFVETSLQVRTALARNPVSMMGSVYRKSFSGWEEQQTGKLSDRKRIPTKAARRGNMKNRIAPSLRMKPSNVFESDKKIIGNSIPPKKRTQGMLSYVRRKKYVKPFLLSGSPKYRKGLYKRVRGKVRLIQATGDIDRSVKRITWMNMAVGEYFRVNPPAKVWKESMKRVLRFKKR